MVYHPGGAGIRALTLLKTENFVAFEALPRDIWERWIPAILRLHYYEDLDEHRMLVERALQNDSREVIKWLIKVLDVEKEEGEYFRVLHKLPEHWDEEA